MLDQLNEVQQLEPIARAIYQEAKEKGELADANGVNMKFRTFFAEHILSISKSALQRLQTLSQLTDEAKNAFEEGLIGKSVAVEIASLDQELQNSFVASIRAGRLSGTLSDLAAHLKASNPEPEAETEENAAEIHFVEEATFSDTTDEPSQENEAFADAEEAPDQAHQQEGHTAYEVTSPVISSYTEDDTRDDYEETQGKPLETLLEEEAGQERLITDALSPSETSDDFLPTTENMDSSNEPITAPEAVRILRELLQSMQASGRAHEAAAIDFALDTMKYRYTWINDPVEV